MAATLQVIGLAVSTAAFFLGLHGSANRKGAARGLFSLLAVAALAGIAASVILLAIPDFFGGSRP
jgi:hypothetical protein